jgi:hypothetical protein
MPYSKLAVPLMKRPAEPSAGRFALETTADPRVDLVSLGAEPASNVETASYVIVPFLARSFLVPCDGV